MTLEYIPGYLGSITLGTDDISASGNVIGMNMTKNGLDKPHFGSAFMDRVSGMRDGTLTASGHGSAGATNELSKLFTLFETDDPIDFEVQIGEASGLDGGKLDGKGIITDYTITGDAEDEWEWSISLAFSGTYTYTPATP
jgi:predicted secreted protein